MIAQNSALHKVQIDKIIPRCYYDYKAVKNNYTGTEINTHLTNACREFCFNTLNQKSVDQCPFFSHCIDIGSYLYYTKDTVGDDQVRRCKYFSYKLMNEIKSKSLVCGNVKNCYNNMFTYIKKPNINLFKDLMHCINHAEDINDDILNIFRQLDVLYDKIEFLEWGSTTQLNIVVNVYLNLLKLCLHDDNKEITGLINALYDYNVEYEKHRTKTPWSTSNPRLPNYKEEKTKLMQELERRKKEALEIKLRTENASTSEIKSYVEFPENLELTASGTWVSISTAGLTIAIFSIFLILYKYTPYFSFLRQMIRKAMRIRNKKINHHLNLINSFEHTYNNPINSNYRIIYSSQDN
ncbi:variable surface protein [Plasmodium gonderi]|uniref:Variable surface protein n=1 Tax=Plasmodium gonderi TaxID=77519 RepID=A0A1Y1JPU6_PLAGO|nr:variable surface protein [Plasmodium gonderi]GAW84501.1 variable surface protein [Plasmodium gonderi]